MPEPTLRGNSLPILQKQIIESSPTQGYTSKQSFAGLDSAQMLALMYDYIRSGVSTQFAFENGIARLEIDDATQNFVLDVWQIVGNEETRDGFEHPTIGKILDDDDVGAIRRGIDDLTSSGSDNSSTSDTIAKMIDAAVPGLDDTDLATVGRFVGLNFRGSTNYRRGQYVLRHTTNAPANWSANVADFGVDQIYSPAQLLSEAQDKSLWKFPIPDRLAYKIAHIPVPADKAFYLWGWLKGASTEGTAANNRIEINTEYCLEQWSTDYYTPYSG